MNEIEGHYRYLCGWHEEDGTVVPLHLTEIWQEAGRWHWEISEVMFMQDGEPQAVEWVRADGVARQLHPAAKKKWEPRGDEDHLFEAIEAGWRFHRALCRQETVDSSQSTVAAP